MLNDDTCTTYPYDVPTINAVSVLYAFYNVCMSMKVACDDELQRVRGGRRQEQLRERETIKRHT